MDQLTNQLPQLAKGRGGGVVGVVGWIFSLSAHAMTITINGMLATNIC